MPHSWKIRANKVAKWSDRWQFSLYCLQGYLATQQRVCPSFIQKFSSFLHYKMLLVLNHIFHLFSQPSKDGKNLIKKPPLAPLIKWARLLIIINAPLTTWFFYISLFILLKMELEKKIGCCRLSEQLGSFTTLRPRSSMNTDLSKKQTNIFGSEKLLMVLQLMIITFFVHSL